MALARGCSLRGADPCFFDAQRQGSRKTIPSKKTAGNSHQVKIAPFKAIQSLDMKNAYSTDSMHDDYGKKVALVCDNAMIKCYAPPGICRFMTHIYNMQLSHDCCQSGAIFSQDGGYFCNSWFNCAWPSRRFCYADDTPRQCRNGFFIRARLRAD